MPVATPTPTNRATGPWRRPAFRLAVLSVAAIVALALLIGPRVLPVIGPAAATPTAGPTFNVPAALTAQVDVAGEMRTGGLWAAQGSYLLTSVDNGDTWHAAHLPTPYGAIYVLDALHAWTIETVSDNSGLAPRLPKSGLAVDRTTDGGYLWQKSGIADAGCRAVDLAFADATHGFLVCLGLDSTDSVYRTDDGGSTWSPAGRTSGLGVRFAVSDAQTLWSAPDFSASETGGVFLSVSRDAGSTWQKAALPVAESLKPAGPNYSTAAGPVFWDASNGAFAVNVYRWGESTPPATWFYRTSDGGRSWTLVKRTTVNPAMDMSIASAAVGRTWAVVRPDAEHGLAVSSDFGVTWKQAAETGMPPNTAWRWLDFTDGVHGAGRVFVAPMADALLLTSDGGRTWVPADFGDARAHVLPDTALDAVTAKKTAEDFETFAFKSPSSAWNRLSSYSQRQFGSEAAFESAEAALAKRTNYSMQVGDAARWDGVGPDAAVWADVRTFADTSRSYAVVVTFPGTSEPPQKLIVAPTTITGEWRVWVVPAG